MNVSWTETDKNMGTLTVEVEADLVDSSLERAFKKVVKRVSLPGFRKGKIPKNVFYKRFGMEALLQDTLDILFSETYEKAITQAGVTPVGVPEVSLQEESMEHGKPYTYTATVTIKPEVILGEYTGLTVEDKDFAVTDQQVEEELQKMREDSMVLDLEEGPAQSGDQVLIDFTGTLDGVAFEGGSAEKYPLSLGKGQFVPGFEEQLIGMIPGEERELDITFPEDYKAADLAGKATKFKVKLHEVKRPILPELNDDFAKDVSEFETLDELKADIRSKLTEEAEKQKKEYVRSQLLEKAVANAQIDIPEVMINEEYKNVNHEFRHRLEMMNIDPDLFLAQDEAKEGGSEWKKRNKETAEQRVRSLLVVEAIAKKEDLGVSNEEVMQTFKEGNLDQMLQSQIQHMVSKAGKDGNQTLDLEKTMGFISKSLLVQKVIDFLVSNQQKQE